MSLDFYVWLAWRLHTLAKPRRSVGRLCTQFGAGFEKLFHFKPRFTEALAAAIAAYPEARVELGEAGSYCVRLGHLAIFLVRVLFQELGMSRGAGGRFS